MHSDIDVVWFRDPLSYFMQRFTVPGGLSLHIFGKYSNKGLIKLLMGNESNDRSTDADELMRCVRFGMPGYLLDVLQPVSNLLN